MRKLHVLFSFAALAVASAIAPARADSLSGGPFRVTADTAAANTCVPKNVYTPGEPIVFRAEIADAATGKRLTGDEIKARGITAVIALKDGSSVKLDYGEHPPFPGVPQKDLYWSGIFPVRADHPTGTLPWTLTVSDSQGRTTTFKPIGQDVGLSVLTLVPRGAPVPANAGGAQIAPPPGGAPNGPPQGAPAPR